MFEGGAATQRAQDSKVRSTIVFGGARALGWFSIGLGMAELVMPRRLSSMIGIRGHERLIRVMGLRELTTGIAVLKEKTPVRSMKARVAGDAVDLALLGLGLMSPLAQKNKMRSALGAVAGVSALDVLCTAHLSKNGASHDIVRTVQTVAVSRSLEDCREFWRNLENLPRFMKHLESVHVGEGGRSHWRAKAPGGTTLEWDAQITRDTPETIAWRSLEGSDVYNAGSVEFQPAPAGHGTIIRVSIEYDRPAGKIGSTVAKLLGEEPAMQVKADLRRFKAIMETGEIPTTEGQSSGRATSRTSTAAAAVTQ